MKLVTIIFCILCLHYSEQETFSRLKILRFLKSQIKNLIDISINGTTCAEDLKRFVEDLYNFEPWALQMLDANSKLNAGILEGDTKMYGHYDQCLSVENKYDKNVIKGQYCTVTLIVKEKTLRTGYDLFSESMKDSKLTTNNLKWESFVKHATSYFGLCVPKSCSTANLDNLWKNLNKFLDFPVKAHFSEKSCYYKDKPVVSTSIDSCVMLFFAFIVTLELVSTVYDIYLQKSGKEPNAFVSFSLYSNTKRLLSEHRENEALGCLYGIKVISMMWIIYGHVIMHKIHFSTNTSGVLLWTTSFKNSIFLAAPYAVDTFFSISGLLVVYVYLRYSAKMKINFMMLYLHRILRIVPALVAVILIHKSFIANYFEGPFAFMSYALFKTNCDENWWATLFFVNNFVSLDEQCVPQTWYLSIDTHMYILSPILMYCITRNPKKTFLGILVICTVSFIYTWTLVVRNHFGFQPIWEVQKEVARYTYLSTICRMPAWFIGTGFGYIIYEHNVRKIHISKKANFALWTLSLFTMTTLTLSQTNFFTREYNVYRSAFFNTFSRPLWSLSVGYTMYSCCTGHGGWINNILSHPVFIVLGKLTYSMFLTHFTIIYTTITNRTQAGYFSNFEIFFEFVGYFVLTLMCAAVLCVVFETPVLSFLRHLEARKKLR